MTIEHNDIFSEMDPQIRQALEESPGGFFPGPVPVHPPMEKKAKPADAIKEAAAVATSTVSPTLAKKFQVLAAGIPGAERFRISKRSDTGELYHLGDYNISEIRAANGDITLFIDKYIKPKFGGGVYPVTIIDATGKQFDAGDVKLLAAAPPAAEKSAMDLVTEMWRNQQQQSQQQVDPIQQMARLEQLRRAVTPQTPAQAGGMDPMMMMMMMQMMQPKGPDPLMMQMAQSMAAVSDRLAKLESTPPPMPMPMLPPPGPVMDAQGIASLITAAAGALSSLRPPERPPEPTVRPTEMAELILRAQQAAATANQNQLSIRDIIDLVRGDNSPRASVIDELEALKALKDTAAGIFGESKPAIQGTTFWDALVALFTNKDWADNIGKIGDNIRTKGPDKLQQTTVTSQPRPVMGGGPTARAPLPPESLAAPQQPPAQDRKIKIPDNSRDLFGKIGAATEEGDRVEATLHTLILFWNDGEQWKPFVQGLLGHVAAGHKEEALRGLGGWFRMFVEHGFLSKEAAIATVQAFDDNWDIVRAGVTNHPVLKNLLAGIAPPEMPPEPEAPASEEETEAPDAAEGPVDAGLPDEDEGEDF